MVTGPKKLNPPACRLVACFRKKGARAAASLLLAAAILTVETAPGGFSVIFAGNGENTAVETIQAEGSESNGEASDSETQAKLKDQREELERQLIELENQITEQQSQVQKYQTEGTTLKSEINRLNSNIKKLNLQIKAVDLSIEKVNQDLTETQRKINRTENKIDKHKDALARSLQSIYEIEDRGMVEILLSTPTISGFFGALNNVTLVQDNLRAALQGIVVLRTDLISQKQEMAAEKEDAEALKNAREREKGNVAKTQSQKETLLKVTKGKESEYKKILAQTKETAAEIRSRIFTLLGGGELTFEKAYEYARLAEKATGVRAAFILAILSQESKLGKHLGGCRYDQIIKATGKPAMSPSQTAVFLEILGKLGIDPKSSAAAISCPIVSDGAYGGAMGPAQFMPSTWKLYEEDISKVTGNNPPSPWNNADAFSATALYLNDSLQSKTCRDYSKQIPEQSQMLRERCAAAQYYAGRNWYTYRFVYGEPVITKASGFEKDIKILNS